MLLQIVQPRGATTGRCPTPPGKTLDEIKPIRDETDRRVRTLLTELAPATA